MLALPAARRYAAIAPAAPHALHMPSHIFLQLGMWPEAAASNEASWTASMAAGEPDFHSLHWLLYAYLQQGRAEDARPLLARAMREPGQSAEGRHPQPGLRGLYPGDHGRHLPGRDGQWNGAPDILPPRQAGGAPRRRAGGDPYKAFAALAQAPAVFARGSRRP